MRLGLPDVAEMIHPSWFTDGVARREEGWSLVCRFDVPPHKQGVPQTRTSISWSTMHPMSVWRLEPLSGYSSRVPVDSQRWRSSIERHVRVMPSNSPNEVFVKGARRSPREGGGALPVAYRVLHPVTCRAHIARPSTSAWRSHSPASLAAQMFTVDAPAGFPIKTRGLEGTS